MDINSLNITTISAKINARLQDEEKIFNDKYNFFSRIVTKIIQIVKSNEAKELFATIEDISLALDNDVIDKNTDSKEKFEYVKTLNMYIDDINNKFKSISAEIDNASDKFDYSFINEMQNLLTDVHELLIINPAKKINHLLV